jgi:hypothetical protein
MGMQAAGGVGERFVELGEFAALERRRRGEVKLQPELLQLLATGGIDCSRRVGCHGAGAAFPMLAYEGQRRRYWLMPIVSVDMRAFDVEFIIYCEKCADESIL